ncbi:EcoRII N-terminal effector-binding domain-containing protein [Flexibacterium corallicola]|uniref:EcoRII N-terminal effector-binding domain-containing protein n=1 Tax=Flexibacterium corallicola TaxID=3037259 RepID=UPI00286EB5CD|nr:EcoRII N-terminal effector-binding domain-containing protein [Pseudovibrio sp. M1P-2-3]
MTRTAFRKILSANDVGLTGGHQAGVLIPKGNTDLLGFLPPLDGGIKNPDAWINCVDDDGVMHRFRFVYYNNKLHDERGTRNEYRVTYMTAWFRNQNAKPGDAFEISRNRGNSDYHIRIIRAETEATPCPEGGAIRLRLKGWQRVH